MSITLEKQIVSDLIKFKLQYLQERTDSILKKWKEENVDDFVQKVRIGEIPEAEMDAITVRQLVLDFSRLQELLNTVNSEES